MEELGSLGAHYRTVFLSQCVQVRFISAEILQRQSSVFHTELIEQTSIDSLCPPSVHPDSVGKEPNRTAIKSDIAWLLFSVSQMQSSQTRGRRNFICARPTKARKWLKKKKRSHQELQSIHTQQTNSVLISRKCVLQERGGTKT